MCQDIVAGPSSSMRSVLAGTISSHLLLDSGGQGVQIKGKMEGNVGDNIAFMTGN